MNSIPLFISTPEVALVVLILVLVFGADKIPDIARNLGKGIRSVKNATSDIKGEISESAQKHLDQGEGSGKKIKEEVTKVKDDIEEITGSIKRRK
jgi:sec-independent protein translocase protein TatA